MLDLCDDRGVAEFVRNLFSRKSVDRREKPDAAIEVRARLALGRTLKGFSEKVRNRLYKMFGLKAVFW